MFSLKNSNNARRGVNFERTGIMSVLILPLFAALRGRQTVKKNLTNVQLKLLININLLVASIGHMKVCESSQN